MFTMQKRDKVVGTRIPKADCDLLDEIVENDIQWNNRGHLLYSIIHSWVEEQRAQKKEKE